MRRSGDRRRFFLRKGCCGDRSGDGFDGASGYAAYYGALRDVARDDGARGHNGIVAYGDAGQDGGVGAYPYAASYHDGGAVGVTPLLRLQVMVEGGEDHFMAYLRTVAYGDPGMVLKLAAGVDEHAAAYVQVFAEVGVEGRENLHRLMYLFAGELTHHGNDVALRPVL